MTIRYFCSRCIHHALCSNKSISVEQNLLTGRNQSLSDRIFSQQTGVEIQRHSRSNGELKQQHEVLLSTLLLEQQLHSTATNQHKQFVKEESLLKLCDELRPNLILTTGGTGISPDDTTPEVLYRDIDDDIQMSEFALQKNVPLELADLGLLATVEPQTIHFYDKLCVVVLSTDNGEIRDSNKIMLMRVLKCTTCYLLSVWHYR
ncbi:unnamed protein product [Rotaria magnacalcarata]|uniref:molybdopterin molybdotransferase n=2 Tax=Rotaria magnacalcarata TaxID=392030 RepID=A0A816TPG8_9BILA|nr:unnamed protein product [Rotaria magnacalcarata]